MTSTAGSSPAQSVRTLAPLHRGRFLVGSLPEFRSASHTFMQRLAADYGDLVRARLGPIELTVLSNPDDVEHVLQTNRANWVKTGSPAYAALRLILGDGLVTSEGDTWLKHRRLVQPAFHRERIAGFAAAMCEEAERTAERFEAVASSGAEVDVAREMVLFTQRVVLRTILSVDPSDESRANAIADALNEVLHFIDNRTNEFIPLPLALPLPGHRRFKAARAVLQREVARIIAQKRAVRRSGRADAGSDLLDMLMAAVDEDTGAVLDDQELFDEVMTLFLAGHETTSNLLSWTLALLSAHQDVDEALAAELRVAGAGVPALMQAPLLGRVISESMRMRPPVWTVDRVAVADDVLSGYHVPAGAIALVSPWVMHHSPRFWTDPERFDPARFLPEHESSRPKLAFIPFIAGQRKCIGDQFALMEARIALGTWLPRFKIRAATMPDEECAVTLRPRAGLPAHIHARR